MAPLNPSTAVPESENGLHRAQPPADGALQIHPEVCEVLSGTDGVSDAGSGAITAALCTGRPPILTISVQLKHRTKFGPHSHSPHKMHRLNFNLHIISAEIS